MKIRAVIVALLIFMSVGVKATGKLSNTQALFIYNFLRLIEWPAGSTGETFVIGVYGNSDTYTQLAAVTKNRKVGNLSIEIRKISSATEAKSCQLVFVSNSQASKIKTLKETLGNSACLLVSEKEGYNRSGSTIEFVLQDNKLRFRINEDLAKAQNLQISRALIDMAI